MNESEYIVSRWPYLCSECRRPPNAELIGPWAASHPCSRRVDERRGEAGNGASGEASNGAYAADDDMPHDGVELVATSGSGGRRAPGLFSVRRCRHEAAIGRLDVERLTNPSAYPLYSGERELLSCEGVSCAIRNAVPVSVTEPAGRDVGFLEPAFGTSARVDWS